MGELFLFLGLIVWALMGLLWRGDRQRLTEKIEKLERELLDIRNFVHESNKNMREEIHEINDKISKWDPQMKRDWNNRF